MEATVEVAFGSNHTMHLPDLRYALPVLSVTSKMRPPAGIHPDKPQEHANRNPHVHRTYPGRRT